MADEAAKAAAGGGTGALPKAAAQGLAPGSGEQAAPPSANAPSAAPGEAGAEVQPSANQPGTTPEQGAGAEADAAAPEGSGTATEPEHHLGFAATMGFAGALVAAVALFFWRRKRS